MPLHWALALIILTHSLSSFIESVSVTTWELLKQLRSLRPTHHVDITPNVGKVDTTRQIISRENNHSSVCVHPTPEMPVVHVVGGDVRVISALSHRITASPAGSDESPSWFVSTSSTLCPTAAVRPSALPNPVRQPRRYRSSGPGKPSIEGTDRGRPLSLVNAYAFSRIGSAISIGKSAIKALSLCASSSVPWIVLI